MAIDLATFRALYPEFDAVADPTVQIQIDRSESYLCPDSWGDCYDAAVLARAAHTLSLSQARVAAAQSVNGAVVVPGGSGAIQSASVDGVSTSFASTGASISDRNSDSWYAQTPYGQEFLALRESCLSPMCMTSVTRTPRVSH